MLRVGLTGGIGAGKSAVARRLAHHGAVIVDSDQLAREVVEPGTPGLAGILERFGLEMLRVDGSLDRARLGAVVFADADARLALNQIVHPLVRERSEELVAAAPPDAVVVDDIPLLVENAMMSMFALVVVVEASPEERLERLVRTRDMSPADAAARMAAQATDEQRRAAADIVLRNDSDLAGLDRAVDALWHDRLAPFGANVAQRRPAGGAAAADTAERERLAARVRVALAPWSPTVTAAPGQGVRLRARLTGATTDEAAVGRALAAAGWVTATEQGKPCVRYADPALPAVLELISTDGR